MHIPVQLLKPTAKIPLYSSAEAAGMDLYADLGGEGATRTFDRGLLSLFPTGIAMAIPRGYYMRIADRSGLALKQGLHVLGGVIDSDYRGEIGVILFNGGSAPVTITHGDRIAQGIIELTVHADLALVAELPGTERGAGGFGSTGVR